MSDFDQWKQSDGNASEPARELSGADTNSELQKQQQEQSNTTQINGPNYTYTNDMHNADMRMQEQKDLGTYTNENTCNYTVENYGQPIGSGDGKKRKGRKLLVAAITVVALLVVGVGGAFVFARAEIMNMLALYTKGDLEYFKHVETQNFEQYKDSLRETAQKNTLPADVQILDEFNLDLNMKVKFGEEFKKNHQMEDLADFGAAMESSYQDKKGNSIIRLLYNNTDILKILTKYNPDEETEFVSIPGFSEDVFDISSYYGNLLSYLSDVQNSDYGDSVSILNEDTVDSFISFYESYFNIYLDSVQNVTVQKGQEVTANDAKARCTEVTADISGEEFLKFLKAVILEMKEDEAFINMCAAGSEISAEEIKEMLASLAVQLDNFSSEDVKSLKVIMTNYVGEKGQILGRQFKFGVGLQSIAIQYVTIPNGNQTDTKASLQVMGVTVFELNAINTIEDDKSSGTIQISFPLAQLLGSDEYNFKFNINYEELVDTDEEFSGTMTIQPEFSENLKIPGTDIKINDYALKFVLSTGNKQVIQIIFMEKNKEAVTFEAAYDIAPYRELETFSTENAVKRERGNIDQPFSKEDILDYFTSLEEKVNNKLYSSWVASLRLRAEASLQIDAPNTYDDDDLEIDTEKDYYFSSAHLANYIDITTFEGVEIDATDEDLMSKLIENALIMEVPIEDIEHAEQELRSILEGAADQMGVDLYEYLDYSESGEDTTKEEIENLIKEAAEDELYKKMVVAFFVDQNDIYLTGDEYKQGVKDLLENKYYDYSLKDLKEFFNIEEPDLVDELITAKVIEYIRETLRTKAE